MTLDTYYNPYFSFSSNPGGNYMMQQTQYLFWAGNILHVVLTDETEACNSGRDLGHHL